MKMNRFLALIFAMILATLAVSSACTAQPSEWIHFTLQPEPSDRGELHATFQRNDRGADKNSWSTGFRPSELIGLDISGFRASGARPLRFAIIREAGRVDCAGTGGDAYASGNCSLAANPSFMQLLASRGIGRPTPDQLFGLVALNVHRELIDGLAAARYPTPALDDILALTALGATGGYIRELAQAGYRPASVHSLIEFKALGINAGWIGGFTRLGYGSIPAEDLVQMKALGITPEFVAGYERIGYRHLPVDTLVQLKALGISPEFVRSVAGARSPMPPVHELVELKLFGRKR
jgi:hypothetical protein